LIRVEDAHVLPRHLNVQFRVGAEHRSALYCGSKGSVNHTDKVKGLLKAAAPALLSA
jgi:hypothetical protein